ncbi:MAG: SH3 domain-containing protein [Clostridia bacterium]|nr:SH3 domain-containing protein [Clostridia bacterium]
MKTKLITGFICLFLLLCCACAALGENVRIVTPRGPLNMRKEPDEKSKLVDTVPNKALVELVEEGETWCKITYKKKTGYVKTEYVKLPSKLIGKEVYADEGTVYLRKEADENAPILLPVNQSQPLIVDSAENGWLLVHTGSISGYVAASLFSYQNEEPAGSPDWMPEKGIAVKSFDLHLTADASSAVLASTPAGQMVDVTVIENDQCLILSGSLCGYAPVSAIALTGPEDTEGQGASISPMEALLQAEAALKKSFKTMAKENLYGIASLKDDSYYCGFFNDSDQYLYGALVDAEKGTVLFTRHYERFAAPIQEDSLLPEGEIMLEQSAETLAVGDVLDLTVHAWTNHESQYTLLQNGKEILSTEKGQHFQASYRPREAGEYAVSVQVTDENGLTRSAVCSFSVDDTLPVQDGIAEVYSQKDGWWADKKYRHSNLGKSGCAIFALSHALQRLGYEGSDILPVNLATKYAYCLIPGEGTSNELLINTAAKDFGFKTQRILINDKKKIEDLIESGTLFSFSIAKGHIAMVSGISADGAMIRVVDSAPSATYERIVNASLYYQMRSGVFRAAITLDDLPGSRWYFETDEYGGLEYWLPMDYVAKRGVRLIQPITE